MLTYPTIRLGSLQPLAALAREFHLDPLVLRGPDCPYDHDTSTMLITMFGGDLIAEPAPGGVAAVAAVGTGAVGRPLGKPALGQLRLETQLAAERELITIKEELDTLRKEALKMPTDVRVSIMKTALQMVEKLTVLADRHTNIRKMTQFQGVVISILDDLVEPDARAQFMDRLKPFIEDGE